MKTQKKNDQTQEITKTQHTKKNTHNTLNTQLSLHTLQKTCLFGVRAVLFHDLSTSTDALLVTGAAAAVDDVADVVEGETEMNVVVVVVTVAVAAEAGIQVIGLTALIGLIALIASGAGAMNGDLQTKVVRPAGTSALISEKN